MSTAWLGIAPAGLCTWRHHLKITAFIVVFFLNKLHNHVKNDMHLLHFKIYKRYQYGFFISFYYLYVSLKSLHVLNVNYFEI